MASDEETHSEPPLAGDTPAEFIVPDASDASERSDRTGDGTVGDVVAEPDRLGDMARDAGEELPTQKEPIADAGIPEEIVPESISETPIEREPTVCPKDSACNARLTSVGACPGDCIPQRNGAFCPGQVAHGLCYDAVLPGPSGPYQNANGLKVTIGSLPAQATIGQAVTISAVLSNPTTNAMIVTLDARPNLPAWKIQSSSFPNPGPVTVPAGGQLQISLAILPERATIFDISDWAALYLNIDNAQISVRLPVGFPPNSGITCGAHSFPQTWCKWDHCKGDGDHYYSGRCCNDVFYPGADCCSNQDCPSGKCFDGLCVANMPNNTFAQTPYVGIQRILVVASDVGISAPTGGVCTKADAATEQKLYLDKVAAWMMDRVKARLGKPMLQVQWHTYIIPDSKVFVPGDGKFDPIDGLNKLEAWLKQQGCITGFDADFDRILLITPRVQVPTTGRAVALNRVVAISYSPHSLLAHELGHVYGGRDLYPTAGGKLQWRSALMSSAEIPTGQPQGSWADVVLWGESGLGDVDGNGVIDIVQWPVDPVALVPGKLQVATFTTTGAPFLKLIIPILAKEPDGTLVPVRIPNLRVSLPDQQLMAASWFGQEATFTGTKFDPTPILQSKQVKVRLEVTWHYTHSDGTRRKLVLDHTETLAIP